MTEARTAMRGDGQLRVSPLAGLVLALLIVPAPAVAQDGAHRSDAARRRAQALTVEAEREYHAGRFDEAAHGYERAYAAYPEPQLLFNIGQCHRRRGRPAQAISYFEAYLRAEPDGPRHALARELIEEARQSLRARATSAGIPRSRPAPLPRAPSTDTPTAAPHRTPGPVDQGADEPGLHERWWFWTGLSVIAAGIAVATVYTVRGEDDARAGTAPGSLGTVRW
jgi:tetratricopeptide (TPR) repeat protein